MPTFELRINVISLRLPRFIAFELNPGIRRQSTVLQRDISRRRGYARRWVNNWGINPAALQLLDERSQLNIICIVNNT